MMRFWNQRELKSGKRNDNGFINLNNFEKWGNTRTHTMDTRNIGVVGIGCQQYWSQQRISFLVLLVVNSVTLKMHSLTAQVIAILYAITLKVTESASLLWLMVGSNKVELFWRNQIALKSKFQSYCEGLSWNGLNVHMHQILKGRGARHLGYSDPQVSSRWS